MIGNCPICDMPLRSEPDMGLIFDCERCGYFELGRQGAPSDLRTILSDPPGAPQPRRRANLSHRVRRRTRTGERHVFVPLAELEHWGLDDPIASPAEVLDRLVLWVGDHVASHAASVPANLQFLAGWLGLALDTPQRPDAGMNWLLNAPAVMDLVEIKDRSAPLALRLTWSGWQRYEALKRQEADSFTAFMAMKFNVAEIDSVVDDHFKPAVAATGFNLRRVTDGQGAGLIDDQMRVGLRTARFVIADLTMASRGAYWEGGFAEGLGKPVIYTCREDHWRAEGSHFDTNHLVTVVWDPLAIGEAMKALKATIRATLPDVAKMED